MPAYLPPEHGQRSHARCANGGVTAEVGSTARRALCWLQTEHADTVAARMPIDEDTRWHEYCQRRQERAHRRLMLACKTLATVSKLLRPQVAQVNIGAQQINVAQAMTATGVPLPGMPGVSDVAQVPAADTIDAEAGGEDPDD